MFYCTTKEAKCQNYAPEGVEFISIPSLYVFRSVNKNSNFGALGASISIARAAHYERVQAWQLALLGGKIGRGVAICP